MSCLCLSASLLVLLGTLVAGTPGGETSNQAQDTGGFSSDPVDRAVITILITDPEPLPVPAALRPALCLEPPYTGPCRALFIRYFYNAKSGLCETFVYGGCRRKQNNFLDKDDCISTCGGRNRALGAPGSWAPLRW
ncbi:pancreatic trypsin inhibitor-like isoform X1 [Balaenoptera musculus]|uniref:Pancreatic trypsin inhibitor-like isoform X1 n=1 Tax=Balaenoptera musculus TaxID=9771 RepID=A0A8B8VCL9_BALMU|nr:pancreatic trypsin inhibitor-like isoform X1 [Balaenoptera musculus]